METILILSCILLALFELPLFVVLTSVSIICFFFLNFEIESLQMILIEMNRLSSMPILASLPIFTLIGCILTNSNAPQRIMNLMKALFGWLPGGVAIASLGSCAFFTALTGASGVTIVALGSLIYPILREQNYEEKFSLGLITTSGSLGLLFPPSIPIILYGVIAEVSISRLYQAALVPGVIIVLVLCLYAYVYERRRAGIGGHVAREPFSLSRLKTTFWEGIWELPIVVLILGGVYGGFVTIGEVSVIVVMYVIIVECFVLREVNWRHQLPGIFVEAAILAGAIIIVLSTALGLTSYLVDEQIPNKILSYLTMVTDNKYVFLMGLNIFLLVVGCLMDIFSAIIIIVPIIVPIAIQYGIDPLHLGVIFMVNLEIGYSTPPIGINLFISSLKFNKPITLLYRSSIPYLILLFLTLLLITYIPALSLWL